MRNLLSANFSRLWKDWTFWLCMGSMLLYSILFMLNGCRQATVDLTEYTYSIDLYYFNFAISIGGFCAVFCSMFLGTEYSDGTIRNKIVAGHTRTSIYLSNLLLTFFATLFMMFVWLISAMAAIPILGMWKMGIPNLLLYLLIAVLFIAVLSAIFTFIAMQSSSKAAAVAISILLFLGLLLFASGIHNSLNQPEMVSNVTLTKNGLEMGEPIPNPNYLSGTIRSVFPFILDFLPTGQGLQMAILEIGHPLRMLLSSAFLTALVTLAGILGYPYHPKQYHERTCHNQPRIGRKHSRILYRPEKTRDYSYDSNA